MYYDDFYNEPSEFEQQIYEFKQALVKAVKEEHQPVCYTNKGWLDEA